VLDDASAGSLVDQVPDRAHVDLRFQDGQVRGNAACNSYGGDYEANDGSLSFGTFMQTAMACDDPVMALESAYLEGLAKVSSYEIDDAGLTLTGEGVILKFTGGGSTTA
jgi:heat shock protein HslJ